MPNFLWLCNRRTIYATYISIYIIYLYRHSCTHPQACTHTHMQQATPLVVCSQEYQWGCFGRAVSEQSGVSSPWSPPGQSQSQRASLQTAVHGHRSGGTDNHTEWMWGSCSLNEQRRITENWIYHWTCNVWCRRASLLRTLLPTGKLILCIYVFTQFMQTFSGYWFCYIICSRSIHLL